ncbi:EamA family transporter [Vibrio sp. Of7-15]|uniref:DMT family transporter n=1 Tax=Vibrio sp. Of7-15 TaxID=2724879 RepID=UPI001EF366B8|nr:EamA family transporter [Vibrio sp. Of7-15]MCG7496517.1 EamA family transporter [Vibrio sp. Of7-15]
MNITLYIVTVLIWGSTWLAIAFQLGDTAITVSIGYRFGLASLILFAFLLLRRTPVLLSLRNHSYAAILGLLLFCTNFICFYYATMYIPSGLIAVIFSLAPILNALNLWWLQSKRPEKSLVEGAIMGCAGILLLFLPQLFNDEQSQHLLLGIALAFAGTCCFSFGNIVSAKAQKSNMPLLPTTAWGMAYGSLYLFALSLFNGESLALPNSEQYLVALLYLALFGSVIGFNTYLLLVGRIGAEKAAYCTVLFPIIALVLSTIFEGYQWSLYGLIGVLLVIIGNLRVFGLLNVKQFTNLHWATNRSN